MAEQGQPIRLPLAVSPENRDETANKDAKIINGFVEQVNQDETWVFKRPGVVPYQSFGSSVGGGIFNWLGDIYAIVGAGLYKNGVYRGALNFDGPRST